MTKRPLRNVAASVHDRLLSAARRDGLPFNDLLQRYGLERWLERLSRSDDAERFVLKGALMLIAWRASALRTTRDIDLLGRMSNDPGEVGDAIARVCATPVADDGVVFDAESVQSERIAEDAVYHGVRCAFVGRLGRALIPMQVDIGFGDVVTPGVMELDYPAMLGHPPIRISGYPRETAIAEKFETMVKLGEVNSRLKDFFHIWSLSESGAFDGGVLGEAIAATFVKRGTAMQAEAVCFSAGFAQDAGRQSAWRAFRGRVRSTSSPEGFSELAAAVRRFLRPIALALAGGLPPPRRWPSHGPWDGA